MYARLKFVSVAASAVAGLFLLADPATVKVANDIAAAAIPAASAAEDLMTAGPLGEKTMGDPKAPHVVIEYASLTCSHCERFHRDIFPEFKKKYIDTGKVYFVFRNFTLNPLDSAAVMIANCAPPERFFPIVDLLYDHQADWAFVDDPATALFNLVKQAGFTQDSFKACLTNQKILDGVNWVRDRADKEFGVDATPTFFFDGEKKSGEQTLEDIAQILGE